MFSVTREMFTQVSQKEMQANFQILCPQIRLLGAIFDSSDDVNVIALRTGLVA